jgi:hypothetical protein
VRAVADRFLYDQDIAIAAVGDTQFLGGERGGVGLLKGELCVGPGPPAGEGAPMLCVTGAPGSWPADLLLTLPAAAASSSPPAPDYNWWRRRTYWIRY